jgi:hypothetical protein
MSAINMATNQAWRAQIGSISVTITIDPIPFNAAAQPLPTYHNQNRMASIQILNH